jgi:hypothetical protein
MAEELATTNEELEAAHEELRMMNEELQSTHHLQATPDRPPNRRDDAGRGESVIDRSC